METIGLDPLFPVWMKCLDLLLFDLVCELLPQWFECCSVLLRFSGPVVVERVIHNHRRSIWGLPL